MCPGQAARIRRGGRRRSSSPGRSEVAQPGDLQPRQPPAHGAQVQFVSQALQVVVVAPARPLPFPAQGLDELHERRRGALRAAPGRRVPIHQTGFPISEVAGHPGGHRGSADPELGGHLRLRDAVVEMAQDHAQPLGRGQGRMTVGHERALWLWTDGVGTSIL